MKRVCATTPQDNGAACVRRRPGTNPLRLLRWRGRHGGVNGAGGFGAGGFETMRVASVPAGGLPARAASVPVASRGSGLLRRPARRGSRRRRSLRHGSQQTAMRSQAALLRRHPGPTPVHSVSRSRRTLRAGRRMSQQVHRQERLESVRRDARPRYRDLRRDLSSGKDRRAAQVSPGDLHIHRKSEPAATPLDRPEQSLMRSSARPHSRIAGEGRAPRCPSRQADANGAARRRL